jgi:hypothetical protein
MLSSASDFFSGFLVSGAGLAASLGLSGAGFLMSGTGSGTGSGLASGAAAGAGVVLSAVSSALSASFGFPPPPA